MHVECMFQHSHRLCALGSLPPREAAPGLSCTPSPLLVTSPQVPSPKHPYLSSAALQKKRLWWVAPLPLAMQGQWKVTPLGHVPLFLKDSSWLCKARSSCGFHNAVYAAATPFSLPPGETHPSPQYGPSMLGHAQNVLNWGGVFRCCHKDTQSICHPL